MPASPSLSSDSQALAEYLHSPNLNILLDLPRPYPEKPLRVSLAEVGDLKGHPVLIFLGLGCVRYLIALYDDLAKVFGLRLICIDRWGFGKTDEVPLERRGPVEWAQVVERVLQEIGVKGEFGVLAHSAGAVYAAALALRMPERIKGRLYLLAPWVSADIDGGEFV
jgi:pimeloyl-ACP methyl ester carboxylesterase